MLTQVANYKCTSFTPHHALQVPLHLPMMSSQKNKKISFHRNHQLLSSSAFNSNDEEQDKKIQYVRPYLKQLFLLCRPTNFPIVTLFHMLGMTVIASAVLLFPTSSVAYESIVQQPNPAAWQSSSVVMGGSAADLSSLTAESITDLGLKPPTEDKPQITLGDRSSVSNESVKRKPIIQGLVFFPEIAPSDPTAKVPPGQQEKQALDYYSDVLVLTAASATQPDLVLAGAKFPVSAVRFPFSFEMYNENLLTSRSGVQNAWDSVEKTGDIIVKAIICPSDASTLPCDINETKKSAQGVAKLITNLPGLKEGETIRAPASLGLQ